MYERYNHLGFFPPYIYKGDNFRSFCDLSPRLKKAGCAIDEAAVCEFVAKFYFLGERTILKGVQKAPWFAKPDGEGWLFADLPMHGNRRMPSTEIADKLRILLKRELLNYLERAKRVGILLSGGMDSRVVAAILAECVREEQLNIEIVAITWGMEGCRDLEYARRIAQKYGWEINCFHLSCDNLLENISVTADYGCEFSPLHLHAMPRIRSVTGFECILAASFGDSIGRGVYSGKHVLDLKGTLSNLRNYFKILRPEVFQESCSMALADVSSYWQRFPREIAWQQHEIDRQVHYMRRQLNPCMAVISNKIPVYQVFGAPKTFGFMWSLSPRDRGDRIYQELLSQVDRSLLDIPWARNGRLYGTGGKEQDDLLAEHNRYGQWIRNDLCKVITDAVLSDDISRLGIFNMQMLEKILKLNKSLSRGETANRIDQILIWIAALAKLVRSLRVGGRGGRKGLTSFFGVAETIAYCALKNAKGN